MSPSKPTFPLPKGYFGPVNLTREQEDAFCDTVRRRLRDALADEHEHVYNDKRQMDPAKWKLAKKKHQLSIYKRRSGSLTPAEEFSKPSMRSVGRMEGSLENVLYGAYDKSHEELKTTMAYMDPGTTDCTVLGNLELAMPNDPFHYVGLKWLLTPLPASFIIKPRDWCLMEAMGIEYDSHGKRYGYHIMHSVNLKNCPPFDPQHIVRGKTQISFIYREPVPGVVEIFSQGLFDPAGEMISRFTMIMTTYVLTSIFQAVKTAEAKKLTLLTLRNFTGKLPFDKVQRFCFMCRGTAGMFSSLKMCRVCGVTVCSQCRVKKTIFIGPTRSLAQVSCCRTCIKAAKNMEIRPAEPQFSILGEQVLPDGERWDDSGSGTPDSRHQTPYSTSDDIRDNTSEITMSDYRLSAGSGAASESDVERIIATMMHQRMHDPEPEFTRSGGAGAAALHHSHSSTSSHYSNSNRGVNLVDPEEFEEKPTMMHHHHHHHPSAGAHYQYDHAVTAPLPPPAAAATQYNSSSRNFNGMTQEQVAIFQKIVALQSAANDVYSITQANSELMRNLK
ncbi:hypothetical protein Gpo141_00003582 [Globisporangium polare]